MNAPWMRAERDSPAGRNSMSPCPSSDSAPFWSRMTRESVWEETANAIRAGTFALIMPVITSALGRWVASTQMDAHRARLLREADDRVLDVGGGDHHQVGELVDHAEDVGQRRLALAHPDPVELREVARLGAAHHAVALLHLLDQVAEHVGGQARAGDDRREQVRDALVVVELHALGVHEHHPHLVRRGAQQDEDSIAFTQPDLPEPVVPAIRMCGCLARSVPIALPAMSLPSQTESGDQPFGALLEHVAEVHHLAHAVGHLDAHRLLAGDRGEDAHLLGGQRVGEVVLELGDLRHLDAGRQPQLVAGHVRAADRADHPRVDVEVGERLHQLAPAALDALRVDLLGAVRALEERRLRHPVVDVVGLGDRRAAVAHRRELGLRSAAPARRSGSGSATSRSVLGSGSASAELLGSSSGS